jgi:hypothetical protein
VALRVHLREGLKHASLLRRRPASAWPPRRGAGPRRDRA